MAAVTQGIKELVKKAIADNNVMIFSKSYCPYCTGAKDLFGDLDVKFNAYELDTRKDGSEIQQALAELTGQKTVPNIFINQNHIGGYSNLDELYRSGKLESLIQKAKL
ncbi:glutaredoxin [Syncephalastrum racemosum]|uniref:Glutaredoxin n=1 Tax=Syncephalastrum racemosum TaxID=13706 RepID=A0A1X2HLR5_SYNRA|nr:glutaredoxin [Syncephalastrum racemosum]